jgi:hypothetical protein
VSASSQSTRRSDRRRLLRPGRDETGGSESGDGGRQSAGPPSPILVAFLARDRGPHEARAEISHWLCLSQGQSDPRIHRLSRGTAQLLRSQADRVRRRLAPVREFVSRNTKP